MTMYSYCYVYIWLPWLRFIRVFSSVVRQMPGQNPQRRGTARNLPNFCVVLCIVCVYMCTLLLPPSGYPIVVKYIIYHIISYHMSYHIISYIISYHIISYCHVMSYYVLSCHVILCLVMSCHVMSCHVMSCHVISYHIIYHIISTVLQWNTTSLFAVKLLVKYHSWPLNFTMLTVHVLSVQNLWSSSLLTKIVKIKIHRTIILPVVLYGCKTWSLT